MFADTNRMMNGDSTVEGMTSGMMGGMFLMGLLWIILLLVLITLGIMAIIILYRRYFAGQSAKAAKQKSQ